MPTSSGAARALPARSVRQAGPRKPLTVIPGGRGVPELITQRRTVALAAPLEGMAFADEVGSIADRLLMAIACGSLNAAANEAGRLGHLAGAARQEFSRMAGDIEGRPGSAA
jgi:hypothetical protein